MESKQYPILDPLAGLPSDSPALPTELNEDGKSIQQLPPRDEKSAWYEGYPELFNVKKKHRANAFDFHVYYCGPAQTAHARALYERVRREFPELRVYKFWEHPVGPHPVPMFEVNTFTPAEFAALFGFLVAYRGPLSVLVHANTADQLADHTGGATWMGERYPLIPVQGLGLPSSSSASH